MEESSKKRIKKFKIISIIFIAILLIPFVSAIIPDIIINMHLISKSGMSTGTIISFVFYAFIVIFIALFVFLAIKALKRHERDAGLAEKIASEYEKTSNDGIENK